MYALCDLPLKSVEEIKQEKKRKRKRQKMMDAEENLWKAICTFL